MKETRNFCSTKIAIFSNREKIGRTSCIYLYIFVIFWVTTSLFTSGAITAEQALFNRSQLNILLNRAKEAYSSGNYQDAVSIWLKLIEEQKLDRDRLAIVYSNLASVYWHTASAGEAARFWQKSPQIYREIKTDRFQEKLAVTLIDTARAYNDLRQPLLIPLVIEALSLTEDIELAKVKGMAYLTLGNAYRIQGNYSSAVNAYQNSLKRIEQVDSELPIVV